MRLRTLLALMFSLLLAFTAASIGWRGYANSRSEIRHFTQQQFALANTFATHHVIDFLDDPADRLLTEFTLRARRGMMKLGDDRALGFDLAERLRVNPTLAWISYSDAATGHFVGASRTAGNNVVLNISSPGQGPAQQLIVNVDGTTAPYERSERDDYDPRERDWFRAAMAAQTTVWSSPYTFNEGVPGITASRAWRETDAGAPVGVFTVDFYLADLEQLLESVAQDFDGTFFSAILEPDGTMISASKSPDAPFLLAALADWVKKNPQFKDNGPTNSHLVPMTVGTTEYLAALDHVNAPSGLKCIVAGMAPRRAIFKGLEKAASQMIEMAVGALAIAVVLGAIMAYRISEPLRLLGNDLASVGQFQLADSNRCRTFVREVKQLNEAADRMKSGLRSFIKYVPGDLVRQVLASGQEAALGGKIQRLTMFFSDIENFTSYSESVPPDKLVHELAEYLEIMTCQLRKHAGTIDKFIGDGVLALFNAPEEVARHEENACRATLAALADVAAWRESRGTLAFRTRVGLHAGDVLVGNIGTAERFAYTVLGDAVNVGSRLESLNKVYGTQVLASGEVRERAGDDFEWRHIDRAAVAGRKGGVEIYELMGMRGGIDAGRLRRRDAYEKALGLYFARSFAEARGIFAGIAEEFPEDRASVLMRARCEAFAASPLPADWDGVFVFEGK